VKISVFGLGYVGAVSGACLARLGHEVIGCDVEPGKVALINSGKPPIVEEAIAEITAKVVADGRLRATTDPAAAVAASDMSLISVGTPSAPDGSLSLLAVDKVSEQIGAALRGKTTHHSVVLRSTVLPGVTEDRVVPILEKASGRKLGDGFDVSFNPEFLREGSSVKDFDQPPFTIIGSNSESGYRAVEQMYAGINAPAIRTTCRIAESVKYLSNAYHAVKITFANEVGALLKAHGVDAREAMDIFARDTQLNISKAYLKPGYAFGGSCLPKDLRALLSMARHVNVDMPFLGNMLASNERHIERAFAMVTKHPRGRVAFFGLSFKPGTDDLRESPLVTLAERLIGRGYDLSIVDTHVDMARLTGANKTFIEREIPHLERLLAKDIDGTLRDAKIIVVGHASKDMAAKIAKHADGKPIIDLQGVAALQALDGATYEGMCW
jgi:GDP-mannose 6-dehydrogenase